MIHGTGFFQVQENVTVDADGAVIFSNTADINSVSNSGSAACVNNDSNVSSGVLVNNAGAASTSTTIMGNASQQNATQPEQDDKLQHYNNINNSNDCPSQQHQMQQPNSTQLQSPQQINPLWWRENLNLDKSKLILIGFSKGCVVLNQVSPIKTV